MGNSSSSSKSIEPAYDIKMLEASYKGWLDEAGITKKKNITTAQARMAASGLRPSSDLWIKNMEGIESDYQDQLKVIGGSETAKIILSEQSRVAKEQKKAQQAQAERDTFNANMDKEYSLYLKNVGSRNASSRSEFVKSFTGRDAISFTNQNKDWFNGGGPGSSLGGPATAV